MKEYEFNENKIFIKNKNNLKRSIIFLVISIIVAGLVILYFNSSISWNLLFSSPTFTFHLPLFFVLVLIGFIVSSFSYKLFDGDKKILYQYTIFGTRAISNFDSLGEIKKIDVYTNSVHSRVRYELAKKGELYDKGILIDYFFPAENEGIRYFEENIIPKINQIIRS